MSLTDQLNHLQDLGKRFVRQLVQLPAHHLLGLTLAGARRPPGTVPGTLFIDPDAMPTRMTVVCFRGSEVETLRNPDLASLRRARTQCERIWVDVTGFGSDELLKAIGQEFALHPMMLADLVNREPQTKTDSADGTHLIVTQVPQLDPESGQPGLDTLGLALGDGWLLSFRARQSALFAPIHDRLGRPESRLRTDPLDYLGYALLDVAIDSLFPVLEAVAARIDQTEDEVLDGRGEDILPAIHDQRRALIALGRLCWRQRDLLSRLLREETVFRQELRIYLQDVHDRTIQLQDMVDATRELSASLIELHMSLSAQSSNKAMQTLTVMASIFIPLTFMAGIYGMNFEYMPELDWEWGYFGLLGLMGVIGLGLYIWFRRRFL
ncbi:magnesium/cobalt transporter CorA [Wenzhouxiangella sp. XN201]|uniref:magnesium/cobalt transporter CorA n=1 Tax=Wenzhouxiangella sp. XN201 TaxID=2710755 RepID=UPI0013C95B6D|nr:magnesium/cobalt transporter CorA [Wenzhouxiangella sp. XN201]NEZ04085.1 magnesium/cobalt transporter CorA [Wenzhouxiangella sp. XN201]